MRKLCGLTVVVLCAGTVSAAVPSTTTTVNIVSTKSTSKVGDQALNLKHAVKIGELKSDAAQTKAGDDRPGKIKQTLSKAEKTSGSSAKAKVLKPLNRRILVFKATWCGACQALNYEWPSMKKVGWRVGEKLTDHIQLVDSDLRPDLVSRYGISRLPTLLLVDGEKELGRQGSLDARNIAEFYYGRLK